MGLFVSFNSTHTRGVTMGQTRKQEFCTWMPLTFFPPHLLGLFFSPVLPLARVTVIIGSMRRYLDLTVIAQVA